MFNKKSQEIKELKDALQGCTVALEKERTDNVLWASTLRNYVCERNQWDKEAKKWQQRYTEVAQINQAQVDLRTRNWTPLNAVTLETTVLRVDDCSCDQEGALECYGNSTSPGCACSGDFPPCERCAG